VFKEAIRLYPPAYVLIREAIRPVEIGDYVLRTGSHVFLPVFVTHRDRRWFEAPTTFRPERFLNSVSEPQPFTYLPFGAGPRHCIGRQLALTTAVRILAAMLRYGCLTLPEGAKEPDFEPLISLRPRAPIRVKVNGL
jgi:cytochrome P450